MLTENIKDKLYTLIFGVSATLMIVSAVVLAVDHFLTIPGLRKKVSELTVQRDTGQSDLTALRAAQEVQTKAINDLVAAAQSRDSKSEAAASARIALARRPPAAAHTAQELNAWLSSLSSQ